jgi:hypothetical protein
MEGAEQTDANESLWPQSHLKTKWVAPEQLVLSPAAHDKHGEIVRNADFTA